MTQQNTEHDTSAHATPRLVGVRFQDAGKPYHFLGSSAMALTVGDWVVVETIYGEQAGRVAYATGKFPDYVQRDKLKAILRPATGLDMAHYELMQKRAARLLEVATEEIEEQNIDAKIVSTEFTLDGRSAIILCTGSPNKHDLANLRRRLASRMSCRVEIRTIGPRDQAKILGGYGVCGEQRCCERFLTEFQAVSIRMAKDQAISMAPTDITGMCGRLRCCLAYEHEVYQEASKALPRIKARVETEKGLGRVIDLDILKAEVIVEIPPHGPRRDRERFRFPADEVEVVKRKT